MENVEVPWTAYCLGIIYKQPPSCVPFVLPLSLRNSTVSYKIRFYNFKPSPNRKRQGHKHDEV